MTQYLYNLNYPKHEMDLCKLEVKVHFEMQLEEKTFISQEKVDPTHSPYLKHRIEVWIVTETFEALLVQIKARKIEASEFMVKYIDLDGQLESRTKKKSYCKQIGMEIVGFPNFNEREHLFAVTTYENRWFFGPLIERPKNWLKHNKKPKNYSSSLGVTIAKAMVSIGCGKKLGLGVIDPCCGAGTVLLEAYDAGHHVEGREINPKVAQAARENVASFYYPINISTGDIKDIVEIYDVALVDLPYGVSAPISESEMKQIIYHTGRISKRFLLVSVCDLEVIIKDFGYTIMEQCEIRKNRKGSLTRRLYLCQSGA